MAGRRYQKEQPGETLGGEFFAGNWTVKSALGHSVGKEEFLNAFRPILKVPAAITECQYLIVSETPDVPELKL